MRTVRVLTVMVVTLCLVNGAVAGWITSGNDMYTDVSGNVGIGTTTPGYRLHLVGKGPRDGIWLSASPAGTDVALLNNMPFGAFNGLVQANDSMVLLVSPKIDDPGSGGLVLGPWSAGETGIRIAPTGRVGIGTRAPHKALHVVGKPIPEGDGIWLSTSGGGTTDVALLNNVGSGSFNNLTRAGDSMVLLMKSKIDDPNSGGLVLGPWSAGATGVRIAPTGNVGIGTATPSQKLHVDGYVKATGYYTGDLFFQKDGQTLWRMYEDQAGLYVENVASGKKYDVVLRESGSAQSAEGDTGVADLKQKVADLEAKLEALAKKLP